MALRHSIIQNPNEVLRIIDEMSDCSELSEGSDSDEEACFDEDQHVEFDETEAEKDDVEDEGEIGVAQHEASTGKNINSEHTSDKNDCETERNNHRIRTRTRVCHSQTATTSHRSRSRSQSPNRTRPVASTSTAARGRPRGRPRGSRTNNVNQNNTTSTPVQSDWDNVFVNRDNAQFNESTGPTFRRNRLPENVRPIDVFGLYFDETIINLFVTETNCNAHAKKTAEPNKNKGKWTDTNPVELRAFFGLCLAMGIVRLPKLRDYWRKKVWLFALPSFGEVMPRDRFLQIYRYLHVCDNSQQIQRGDDGFDPLFKVRVLLNVLGDRFRSLYNVKKEVSIDESMIPYKGRIYFRQYIPSKRARFGIKAFVLAESESGYVSEIQIYTGARVEGREVDLASRVVRDLVANICDKGHHLYTDNYYTKVALLEELYEKQIYCCGTARVDRSGFPKEIIQKSKRGCQRGDYNWRMNSPVLACVWIDNKPVHFLSTIHKPEYDTIVPAEDRFVKRRGKKGERDGIDVPCPPMVHCYNKFMGGVDFSDRIIKFYNCARRSRKWYRRVIFHLLELCVHNSFVLEGSYVQHYSGGKLKRYHQDYREELAEQLIGGYRAGNNKGGRPSDAYAREDRFVNVGDHLPIFAKKQDCAWCLQKVKRQQPGGVIPRGVSRHALGVSRPSISCTRCQVSLCISEKDCWRSWHQRV